MDSNKIKPSDRIVDILTTVFLSAIVCVAIVWGYDTWYAQKLVFADITKFTQEEEQKFFDFWKGEISAGRVNAQDRTSFEKLYSGHTERVKEAVVSAYAQIPNRYAVISDVFGSTVVKNVPVVEIGSDGE